MNYAFTLEKQLNYRMNFTQNKAKCDQHYHQAARAHIVRFMRFIHQLFSLLGRTLGPTQTVSAFIHFQSGEILFNIDRLFSRVVRYIGYFSREIETFIYTYDIRLYYRTIHNLYFVHDYDCISYCVNF
jgi:hypothetical protein